MNARTIRRSHALPAWQRAVLWGVPTALLALFAYALPMWFITVLCLSFLVLRDSTHGRGRDWGNT